MTDTFRIATFLNELDRKGGPLSASLYTVELSLPGTLANTEKSKTLALFCESAPLPGLTLGTDDSIQPYGYGPTQRAVWGAVFGDFTLDFIVDASGTTRQIILDWIDSIVHFNTTQDITAATNKGQPFFVSYYKDYTTQMKVYSHNAIGSKVFATTFYEVYPYRVVETQLSNAAIDTYVKMSVTFSSNRWSTASFALSQTTNTSVSNILTSAITDISNSPAAQFNALSGRSLSIADMFNSITNVNSSATPSITDQYLNTTNGITLNSIVKPIDTIFDMTQMFESDIGQLDLKINSFFIGLL